MIKDNVDLTKNQMFSRGESFSLRRIKTSLFGAKLPWDFRPLRMPSRKFEAIRTGDREERETKELCDEEMSRDYCDCCGAYLANIPWDRTYGLCQKCSDRLDRAVKISPWEEKTQTDQNNEVQSLNW